MSLMSSPAMLQRPAAPRKQRRRRSRIGFIAVLALVFVVLPTLCVEGYLRLYKQHYDLMQLTGRLIGENPIKQWGQVDAFSAYHGRPGSVALGKTINSHGFISTPELSVAKPADVLRIVFLGGSSTAGTGKDLADEDTWPWIVAEELQPSVPAGKRLEFINGALGGYSTFESYGRLWSRLRLYEPDIVVVNHAWNDMYYFNKVDPEQLVRYQMLPDGDWSLDRTPKEMDLLDPWAADVLLQYSQLAVRGRIRLAGLAGEVGSKKELQPDFDARGFEVYRFNLRLIRSACDLMGAELFVCHQATLIVPDLPEAERARCRYDFHGFDHDAHVRAYAGLYRVIDEEIPPERVIPLDRLSGEPAVFEDHVHPTVAGARRFAAIVADAVAPVLSTLER